MAEFSDNFDRPDGPLGNGWTQTGYLMRILSHEVTTGTAGSAKRIIAVGSPYHQSAIDSRYTTGSKAHSRPVVKCNASGSSNYQGYCQETLTGYSYSIIRVVNGAQATIASGAVAMPRTNPARLALTYNAGVLTFSINGQAVASVNDNTLAAEDYQGFTVPASTYFVDNFAGSTDSPVAFDETVEPLVQAAQEAGVEFVGTGTAWTPGAPGNPIFQVDKGTLSGQEIQSPTQATAMYTPPSVQDTARFTDPSTGQFDDVALDTGFNVLTGGECKLTDAGAAVVNAAGSAHPASLVLTEAAVVDETNGIYINGPWGELLIGKRLQVGTGGTFQQGDPGLLYKLWRILNGQADPDPELTLLGELVSVYNVAVEDRVYLENLTAFGTVGLADLLGQPYGLTPSITRVLEVLDEIRTGDQLTLGDVTAAIAFLRGADSQDLTTVFNVADTVRQNELAHYQDVVGKLDLLTGTDSVSLIDVQEDIAAIRGEEGYTLVDVGGWFSHLTSGDTIHLQDILTAIDNIPGVDLTTVTQMLQTITDSLTAHRQAVESQLTGIATMLSDFTAAFYPWASGVNTQLTNMRADILAAIAAIRPADYPLWPGLANATLGDPVEGVLELTIPGPLDGLLIDVTSWPSDINAWHNGGRTGLKWAGAITFVSDNGYIEEIQFPGADKRVAVPKSMLTAASAIVHLRPGVRATVTPWIYNA